MKVAALPKRKDVSPRNALSAVKAILCGKTDPGKTNNICKEDYKYVHGALSHMQMRELVKLAKTDPRKYFDEMKHWAVNRMTNLREQGWRKANE